MNTAYLLIGGNLGDRAMNLALARQAIAETCGPIRSSSLIYESEAWGKTDQPTFLNQALKINTRLSARGLLTMILSIEKKMGRERKEKYGARLIDIDILFYNRAIIQHTHLTVPHPELANRRFALIPLKEIAPRLVHPLLRKTVTTLLKECKDPLQVKPID